MMIEEEKKELVLQESLETLALKGNLKKNSSSQI